MSHVEPGSVATEQKGPKTLADFRPKGRKRAHIAHAATPITDMGLARLIGGQAKRGRIWVAVWGPGRWRICLTKSDAEFAQRVWREWKKRQGWTVVGAIARRGDQAEACVIHAYDATTFERQDV